MPRLRHLLPLFAVAWAAPLAAQIGAEVPEPTDATRKRVIARRATGSIAVDGRLDEPDWVRAHVATDFAQSRPDYQRTTAYPTEVRVLFDAEHLYIGAFNRDSAGLAQLRLPDLRRDFNAQEADVFAATLAPLGDRRTTFQFQATPLGSQADVQAFDGGDAFNFNWDTMWRVRTTRADSGWTVEMAIPWQSLRYAPGLTRWAANFVRNTRRAAQWSAWMPFPRQFSSWRITYGGVIDSLEPPPPRTNIRIRPYALGQTPLTGDRVMIGDVGGEVIWAPTVNSVVEATVNTDFAQADVDRQVVNLTRFGVFFPERRQFFLENADLLTAGGLSGRYVVQPFFSRRIGLADDGTLLPIDGGLRYSYRSGRSTVGALAMRQGAAGHQGAATFAVARGSRFFGRSNRVGATVAVRDDAVTAPATGGRNVVTAVDLFGRRGELVQYQATVSTSTDTGTTGVAVTYVAGRTTARSYVGILGAWVTDDYRPRTGFVSRPNVFLTSPAASLTLQPTWLPERVVWLRPSLTTFFYQDPTDLRLQEGVIDARLEVLSRTAAAAVVYAEHNLQRPDAPITLFPGVTTPAGTHDYLRYGLNLRSDQSAAVAWSANLSAGDFFDGALERAELAARWSPTPYVALSAAYEVNRLRSLGAHDSSFTTHLAAPELRLFLNPRVQWSAFYQYNTAARVGALNARFSWEFTPLSYLFVVYNDRRAVEGGTAPRSDQLIVKLSWLRQL
jgi:hypothetical protein